MNLEGLEDAIRCKAFPVTLSGLAMAWFNSLPSGTVYSFADIKSKFLAHFTTKRTQAKHSISLFGVEQRVGKAFEIIWIASIKRC
ncbi:hypothetical protein AHAS_Ahas15G0013800 [Arachis hypogaea]